MEGLIDVYKNAELFQVDFEDKHWSGGLRGSHLENLKNDAPILFEEVRFKGSPGKADEEAVIVDSVTFVELFETTSLGVLQKVDDWSNCIVAGGQVLGCLQGMAPDVDKPSDIDIFIYGLNEEQGLAKVRKLLEQIHEGYKIASHPHVHIDVVKTDHTLTLIPKVHEAELGDAPEAPLPMVQVVTRKFSDPGDILACFDVDCCCVAYDYTRVWASPRAVRALRTSVNIVDLQFRSARFENRLLKYTRRGFAVQDLEMRGNVAACLGNYFGGRTETEETGLDDLVRCIRQSKGLLKLLLADLAGTRGVIWASAIVDSASFGGAAPEDRIRQEYGDKAFDAEKGPLVFNPPLVHEPWMAQYEHRPLTKLLEEWGNESTLQKHFSLLDPEVNSSRADWEHGVYVTTIEQMEALWKLPFPAPTLSTASSPMRALLLDGEPGKRPRSDPDAKLTASDEGSPLLALPNLLLVEVLNRCTAESVAAAAMSCTTLERTVALGGVWKHLYLRDFFPTTLPDFNPHPPADIPRQEAPADVYRDLRTLKHMGWAEWDVNPMRAQAARKEESVEYEQNVPLECRNHATVVLRDQLVLTGGMKLDASFSGTFVFDLVKKEWRKVPTKLRCRNLTGPGFHTFDWELPSRHGHTMTAINGHEAVILFGKRALTAAEQQRVQDARTAAANAFPPAAPGQNAAQFMERFNMVFEAGLAAEIAILNEMENGHHAAAYVLDIDTWTYEEIESDGLPPIHRQGHTAVLHPNQQGVVVFGGQMLIEQSVREQSDVSNQGRLIELTWTLEDGKRVWAWRELEATGEEPRAEHGHGACVVGDRMVVVGGRKDGPLSHARTEVWVLDFKTMQWSHIQPSTPPLLIPYLRLYSGDPVVVGENLLLVVGGMDTYYFNVPTSCWHRLEFKGESRLADGADPRFIMHGGGPKERTGHTTVRYGFSVYVVGGKTGDAKAFEQMPVLELLGYESGLRC